MVLNRISFYNPSHSLLEPQSGVLIYPLYTYTTEGPTGHTPLDSDTVFTPARSIPGPWHDAQALETVANSDEAVLSLSCRRLPRYP